MTGWWLTCRRARRLVALAVGDDLTAQERLALERHLAGCPDCRQYQAELERRLAPVRAFETAPADDESLWPAISERLELVRPPRRREWSEWTPLVAIAAACLLVAFVSLRYTGTQYEQPEPAGPLSVAPAVSRNTGSAEEEPAAERLEEQQPAAEVELEGMKLEAEEEQTPLFRWPRPDELNSTHRPHVPVVPVNEWRSQDY